VKYPLLSMPEIRARAKTGKPYSTEEWEQIKESIAVIAGTYKGNQEVTGEGSFIELLEGIGEDETSNYIK
jgi:hypothetical protein